MTTSLDEARQLFAEMAIQKGYCSQKDIEKALKIQGEMKRKHHHPKMLGLILLQEGLVDNSQFLDLLVDLDHVVHDEDPDDLPGDKDG